MGTDLKWLQGRVVENSKEERKDLDRLLIGFLQSLLEEQVPAIEAQEDESPRSGAV